MLDYKITGGKVFDGTGGDAVPCDLGIKNGIITSTGDLSKEASRGTIDAAGKCVCPGFIDMHSHSDAFLMIDPSAASKILQGVTTEVVGNCGASAFPLTEKNRMPSDWAAQRYTREWKSAGEYFDALSSAKPAVNVVCLTGHNTLRAAVMGYDNRPASVEEMHQMEVLLEECMENGARGISTGLVYPPGMFTPPGEIKRLAAVVARRGGIYATHMRNEGTRLVEAVRETLDIGGSSGVKVQISHLKTSGKKSWHLLNPVLEILENARSRGMDVTADRYPYTAGYTDLDILFPSWASEGDRKTVMNRLADSDTRNRLIGEIRDSRDEEDWGFVILASIFSREFRQFRGRKAADVAAEMGCHPSEAIVRILEADELKTTAFFSGMSEANMMKILAQPWVMAGSDASIRNPEGPLGIDYPHPRAYGTFPRFLRMALDGETVGTGEAIRKMTSLPASKLGLKDRGLLKKNNIADVLVFDPASVRDTATYSNPHSFAQGICDVFVNGQPCVLKGKITGERTGRILR